MSEELLINVTPMECRVALIENGTVNELYVERTVKRGLVGNIYKGKVVRVLPGMQAAFVDIGLSRTAFCILMIWFGHVHSQLQMCLNYFIQADSYRSGDEGYARY